MKKNGNNHVVLQEILSQPQIWEKTFDVLKDTGDIPLGNETKAGTRGPIILAGCGSSYYLSLAVTPLWESRHNAPVRAISATDLLTYPEGYLNRSTPGTLMAVSRSGKTNR